MWKKPTDTEAQGSQGQKISCTIALSQYEVTEALEECDEYTERLAEEQRIRDMEPNDEPLGQSNNAPPPSNSDNGGWSSHGGPP